MSAYIQERDAGGTEDGEDLLLDQLMVGLCAGPIKQELSRQLRRDEQLTFSVACKEAQALEQELQEGKEVANSQRVTAPPPGNDRSHLEQLKSQFREELQQGPMGEMREQMKALSVSLMEEVRVQLATREAPPAPTCVPQKRQRQAPMSAYQWDAEGRPIWPNYYASNQWLFHPRQRCWCGHRYLKVPLNRHVM